MKEIIHPFIKYGAAVVLRASNLSKVEDVSSVELIRELEVSLSHFRLKPRSYIQGQNKVYFDYVNEPEPGAPKGIYLSPSIIHIDKTSKKNMYSALVKMKNDLGNISVEKSIKITNTIAPVSAEYGGFNGGTVGRAKASLTLKEGAFSLITTTTPTKPCFSIRTTEKDKGKQVSKYENVTIIPDLDIDKMVDFINHFERMKSNSTQELNISINHKDSTKPSKPLIYRGNFPNAPRSSSLGAVGLLGAIGSWAKNAEDIEWAKRVLSSLEDVSIYLIGTKTFQTFKYNHFVIELAKESKLSSIIDSAYYTVLYNQGRRNTKNKTEYEKFDLFLSRFLQLFSIPAFKDFLSFRAEYPNQFELLLNKYFINMENIKPEVVKSARELGKWLNYAAYKVADRNIEANAQDRFNKVREQKAKSLIEIESSIFSARSGDALIFQAITRAGRASGLDAPAEAELFMTETSTGGISLESAKHLLIAFSRVKNKFEKSSSPGNDDVDSDDDSDEQNDSDDLSDAQE